MILVAFFTLRLRSGRGANLATNCQAYSETNAGSKRAGARSRGKKPGQEAGAIDRSWRGLNLLSGILL